MIDLGINHRDQRRKTVQKPFSEEEKQRIRSFTHKEVPEPYSRAIWEIWAKGGSATEENIRSVLESWSVGDVDESHVEAAKHMFEILDLICSS